MPALTFDESEIELVNEALHRMLDDKREVMRGLDELPPDSPMRQLTARDFGVPQIECILNRIQQLPPGE